MKHINQYPLATEVCDGDRVKPVRVEGTTLLIDCDRNLSASLICDQDGHGLHQLSDQARLEFRDIRISSESLRPLAEWIRNNCPKQYLI